MTENGGNIVLNVLYSINKRTEQSVNNSVEKLKKKSSGVESAYTKAFGKIGKAAAAAFSIAAVTRFINASTNLYKVQMTAETKLETVMRQRMKATDAQIQQVKDLCAEYQRLGVVGDEVAMTGMAQLSTFLKNPQSLEKLMPNFQNALVGMYGLDVSAQQAQQFANQLGKALANGSLSALAKSGITFTDAEKKAFEMANEIERAEILSQALVSNYGEMSAVMAKTPLGRITQLKNSFNDLRELFGQAFSNLAATFVPILQKIVDFLTSIANKLVLVSELIYKAFGGVLQKNGGAVGGLAGDLEDLASGYEDVGSAASGAKESLASFDNVVQLADTSGSGGVSGAGADSFEAIQLDNGPLKEADTILDGLLTKVKKFFNQPLFDFSKIKNDFERIGKTAKDIFENIRPSAEGFVLSYINYIKQSILTFYQVGKTLAETITKGIADSLEENKPKIIEDLNSIFGNLTTIYNNFSNIIKIIGDTITKFLELDTTVGFISNTITAITNVINGLVRFITTVIAYITTKIKDFLNNHKTEIDRFFKTLSETLYEISETIKIVVNKVIDYFKTYVMPVLEFIFDGIFAQADELITGIINICEGLLTKVKGVFEIINGILTGDSEKAWKGLVDVVKGSANSVVSLVEMCVNGVISGINWVIKGINKLKIPGTDIGLKVSEMSRVNIPRLKDGGIVYKPTDFGNYIAGEAGAEAIVPLQNSSYTKELANEIVKGITAAGIGGGDTYNIDNAFGDDRSMERLVKRIAEEMKKQNVRKGAVSYA